MLAEVSCASKPFTVIPMVGDGSAGRHRDRAATPDRPIAGLRTTQAARPGSLTVFLEPLYEGGIEILLRPAATA